jgi:succinate dehydrogenase/fumarate reductase flavoprotein subunit
VAHTGNSSLALSAGAKFSNLSEWQYGLASTDFRWNVSGTYQQVLPRYISIDKDGVEREFLTEYFNDPSEMLKNVFLKGYEWPFDVRKIYGSSYIDLIVYHESVILGRAVYMDFTREPSGLESGFDLLDSVTYDYLSRSDALISTPIARLRKMNPGAIELYASHGIDITRTPLRVAVCAQHNNGGVRIDSNWQSTVKGLYAAGEAAGSLGIFRPGGSALNSCQVGSMRAAEHIVCSSTNEVSDRFDSLLADAMNWAEGIIKDTYDGSRSTVREMRDRYSARMSRKYAFLRNISDMTRGLEEIKNDRESFISDNKWSKHTEIPAVFKNLDILLMQDAVARSILFAAENFGSRGSAYVLKGGDFMDRAPISENAEGRKCAIVAGDFDGEVSVDTVSVRPIPERNLWFESVWSDYRRRMGGQ